MIVFALYAALVLYFAMRYRRRWQGIVAVVLGVTALLMFINLVTAERTFFGLRTEHIVLLLWGETAIVASVGLFAVCLPRARKDMECRKCGYDLSDLDPVDLSCPECGALWRGDGSGLEHDRTKVKLTPMIKHGRPKRPGI